MSQKIDRYEILSELGRGGMGVVYRAHDPDLNKDVAIKMLISNQFNPSHFVRFQTEAKAMSKLKHPGFVLVHSFGLDGNNPYMVLEYVDGIVLKTYLEEHGPLEPIVACKLVVDVADAMAHAHDHRVLHRDLKSSNIMVVENDGVLSARIIDFGIAVVMEQEMQEEYLTQRKSVIGTPAYMSPEQIQNKPIDRRSDIYSLACVFFEMLTGVPPYSGESAMEVFEKHLKEEPPAALPATFDKLSLELNNIIVKALAKEPAERYRSMDQLEYAILKAVDASAPEEGAKQRSEFEHPTIDSKLKTAWVVCSIVVVGLIAATVAAIQYVYPASDIEKTRRRADLTDSRNNSLEYQTVQHSFDAVIESEDIFCKRMVKGQSKEHELKLDKGSLTDKGARYLENFHGPRYLFINTNSFITDAGLKYVSTMVDLKELSLDRCTKLTSKGFSYLKAMKSLYKLSVEETNLDADGLTEIAKCSWLPELHLSYNKAVGDSELKFLSGMPYLQRLEIKGCNLHGKNLDRLAKVKNLWSLRIGENDFDDRELIKVIETCRQLKYLDISHSTVGDAVLDAASKSPSLECLMIIDCPNMTTAGRVRFHKSKPDKFKFIEKRTTVINKDQRFNNDKPYQIDPLLLEPSLLQKYKEELKERKSHNKSKRKFHDDKPERLELKNW